MPNNRMPSETKNTPLISGCKRGAAQVLHFPTRPPNARPLRPVCEAIVRDIERNFRSLSASYRERLPVIRAIASDHLRELESEGKVAA